MDIYFKRIDGYNRDGHIYYRVTPFVADSPLSAFEQVNRDNLRFQNQDSSVLYVVTLVDEAEFNRFSAWAEDLSAVAIPLLPEDIEDIKL